MKRIVLAGMLVLLAASAALARHHAWVGGAGVGPFGPAFVGGPSSTGGGGGGNNLLLELAGSNFLLLEDGSSNLCLESGC